MTSLAVSDSTTATLQHAIEGDEAAFAHIVADHHADMVRVAYGICGDALDAVQAAWLVAMRKLRTVREPEHLRSWLVAVAANEARHLARHRGEVVEIALDVPDRRDVDPQAEISRVDLVNALGRLKPDERSLIALRYGAELDSGEIAARLGISASGVRSRLFRIIGRLRKDLDDARA
jgi:RNA polymerase sigma-70 factor (ECF subfamily)